MVDPPQMLRERGAGLFSRVLAFFAVDDAFFKWIAILGILALGLIVSLLAVLGILNLQYRWRRWKRNR